MPYLAMGHILNFIITCSLNITKMTRFFGGLSEWAISFLTGANLYDWTDDSKKTEI